MSAPNASVSLSNGNLGGITATNDGIMGLVVTGAAEGTVALNTPFALTSLEDLIALGITSGTATNTRLYKEVREYYAELQGRGMLYVMVVASTTTVDTVADGSQANGVKKLLDYGKGDIKAVGLMITPQASPTVTNGINALVYTAATNLQATLNTYASAQRPARGIIAADSFNGTAANLTNMRTSTLNRVGLLLGDTVNTNVGAAVGMALGRLARIPVMRKISRVKDGATSSATGYVGAADVETYTGVDAVFDKGFISLRTFAGKAGIYFSTDQTCTAASDDYSSLARGRVIDKAHRIAYATAVDEVEDDIDTAAGGVVAPAYAAWLEEKIKGQVDLKMAGEIVDSAVSVDPTWNVTSTNQIKAVVKVQPKGYASFLLLSLGFALDLSA